MKAVTAISLFLFVSISLHAQKPPVKFGEVTKEELSMTRYDKDSSAAAVILADYGESAIIYRQNVGFTLDFSRTTRIKILTKDGLRWGDFEIHLYKSGSNEEKITSLKAVTYNLENGKIVESKVKSDGIFKEEYDVNRDITKVTCPNVKEGSVVEISYKINSPFTFNFQDWRFQDAIPTIVSEYRAQIPEYFTYEKYMQGYIPLDVADETRASNSIRLTSFERSGGYTTTSTAVTDQIDYQDIKYRWVANNVPAFKPEPYMTTINDYIAKMNFELSYIKFPNRPIEQIMGTWGEINKNFDESENFGGAIRGNNFLSKLAEEAIAGATSAEEKIGRIANFVKLNVMWDGRERMYASQPFRKVLDEKKGSSAEINLLLASMLEKVGVQVRPVLLSTRSHGLLREAMPVASQFNYVICMAVFDGKILLLDATERLLPIGMLPERCLNGKGFAISKEGFQWIPLDSKFKTRVATSMDLSFTSDGTLQGKLKRDCNGYAALSNRKKYLVDGESEYMKSLVGSHSWELKHTEFKNTKEITDNFIEEHDLVISENIVQAGDVVYVEPFIQNQLKENPFKTEKREYPVDFGSPSENTFFLKLSIPEGYVVDELPQTKMIAMPENAAKYIYSASQAGNTITITSMFHINKSLFTQIEYPTLREFYNQVVAKQAEQIVLKKKQ